MPLEPHEREEIDRLWNEHNAAAVLLRDQQLRLHLFEDRLERMGADAAKSSAQVSMQLDHLSMTVQSLRESILKVRVRNDVKGGLIDRWLPMLISLVAILVAAKDLLI
jgi:hypothetical protein